jgi:hypothetical protein
MDTHEVDELLKHLHVMETHYNNASQELGKLKARLDQLNKELRDKKK